MMGASTKISPTWNTRSASSRAVSIWDANCVCCASTEITPLPSASAEPSLENWSSSSW